MPYGKVAEVRTVTCRHCGEPFDSDRIGRQAWYCQRAACNASRLAAKRKQWRERARKQRGRVVVVHAPPGELRDAARAVVRMAAELPPTEARLKAAVAAYRECPSAASARVIAAAGLALAVDLERTHREMVA